jgi:hypothetical protein
MVAVLTATGFAFRERMQFMMRPQVAWEGIS